jgi:hypothetical protein
MNRVTLRLESLDGRILPGKCGGGGVEVRQPAVAVIDDGGSKPGATGEGIQVFGSKPTASGGIGLTDNGTSFELFGTGYKPGTTGGQGATGGVVLFGSMPVASAGSNSVGHTDSGVDLLGGSKLGISAGGGLTAIDTGIELFGSKVSTASAQN